MGWWFQLFISVPAYMPLSNIPALFTVRSRVLLSMGEEEEVQEFGPHAPFSYKWFLGGIFGGGCAASEEHTAGQSHEPTLPRVNVMDVETEINQTGDIDVAAPSRQPDIAVTTSSKPINATS